MLIEKLQEQLAEFDKKAKLNTRLMLRKERLAYVTVNLSNIIQVVISVVCSSFHIVFALVCCACAMSMTSIYVCGL